ncbi:hypothetical protein HHK36_005203 [Tetracentron sinense]|uniref:Uncharacterized protein n=1 Tax=Tetracentron sinense TaxID=13715 RepID=A0A834ZKK3_TETSI|nr:hypothetical protein HHK36_005203 [Tetracentron sinense]
MAAVLAIPNTLLALFIIFLTLIYFPATGVEAQPEAGGAEIQARHLPNGEVDALRQIAKQLGKNDWNFSANPCDGDPSWRTAIDPERPLFNNSLTCNCSFPNGECHVDSIILKGQNLSGVLPPDLGKLPYIKTFDLSRNYLSGTIPREWASTQLEYLYVTANRLSGPIPKELGNVTTLKRLILEANWFSGALPSELGYLINIENITLNSNNFTGELPMSLANLTKLTELRISSNSFMGKIPDFIENWRQLDKLEIQASGLEGPIPTSISSLDKLSELRISDLNGAGSVFPLIGNMTGLKKLMLRNCNISGQIPQDIAVLTNLNTL